MLTLTKTTLLCRKSPLQTITSGTNTGVTPQAIVPKIHCTNDMCPVRLHWHVKQNYQAYWRVKLTISNRNYAQNYSQWNVVIQHPNFDNLTEVFSFTYKSLNPYGDAISKYPNCNIEMPNPSRLGHFLLVHDLAC